jgi:hypothetical protein
MSHHRPALAFGWSWRATAAKCGKLRTIRKRQPQTVSPNHPVYNFCSAPVAQLDRANASGALGREFESLRAHHSSYSLLAISLMFWPRIIAALLCSATMLAAQDLPTGTALPVMLSSTLNSKDNKPGEKIEGKLMQEVLLPSGAKIKSGSHLTGHVILAEVTGSVSRITLTFDTLENQGHTIPLNVSLRAMAATESVFQAKTPIDAASTYESSYGWTTKQVGGDVVFRGRGYIASPQGKVGRWNGTGAWGKLTPAGDCVTTNSNDQEQALGVFSTTACGIYGFENLKLTHPGSTAPLGQITLESTTDLLIRGGSGWLLLVNTASGNSANPK